MKYASHMAALLFITTGACTGSINDSDRSEGGEAGDDQPSGRGSSPSQPGGGGGNHADDPIVPGPSSLRRLSNFEYLNSVRDLLGSPDTVLAKLQMVADHAPDTFDHNVDLQTLNAEHLRRYAAAAKALADDAFASPERRKGLLGCDAPANEACLRAFVERFGLRVYRRPLETAEVDGYLKLAAGESDRESGARLVVRTMLQAPSFLFRPEVGVASAQGDWRRLTGFELATRLSYLLWGTTPSMDLLDEAQRGGLDDRAGALAMANKLLDDDRSKQSLRRFVEQGFGTRDLAELTRDAKKFPGWTADARRSAAEELTRLADHLIWSEGSDFRDLIDARYTFVDQHVARLYGLPAPPSPGWHKLEFDADEPRAGIVTMPALLALTGRQDGASAIWRGAFVRTQLLCETLPPPPANVPPLENIDATLPERERLAQHRDNPACASCHSLIDPIGFGLSRYDAIGGYRTQDEAGRPITDDGFIEGDIAGIADGNFHGGVELARKLRNSPQVTECLTRKLTGFLLGRNLADADAPLVAALHDTLADGGRVPALLLDYVGSDAFRFIEP